MSLILTQPFGRVGSKASIRNQIYSLFNKLNFNTYVEPFVGGGSIYFGYDWEGKKTVINDIDKNLIRSYNILKRGISGDIEKYNTGDIPKLKSFVSRPQSSDLGFIVKFRICSNNTFGSTGRGDIYKGTNPYLMLKKKDEYKEKLKNTTILSQDYKTVIRKYDNPNALIYLDPPYEKSTKLYKDGDMNFEELSKVLNSVKGKFILSINDSPNIKNLFNNFKKKVIITGGSGNSGIGEKKRKELIIYNF